MFEHGFMNKNLIQSQIKEVNDHYSKVTAVETAFKNTATKDHVRNGSKSKESSVEPPRGSFVPASEVIAKQKTSAIVAANINSNR